MSEVDLTALLMRAEAVLARLEGCLPTVPAEPDWQHHAFRWRKQPGLLRSGYLQPVPQYARTAMRLADLQHIDEQKKLIEQNTRQFVAGAPANNVLLTGARGTGKSSLIKACLNQFAKKGLRLIEVDKTDLVDLADIVGLIANRPERFIIFCDDLSFETGEPGYKALKVVLDGSIAAASDNVLVYATSNRRHLMPEYLHENLTYAHQDDGEIHPGEGVEEKISLSERFGLWVSFQPFRQENYWDIVQHWLRHLGCTAAQIEASRPEALRFTIERGSRSGRVAWQFARHYAGQLQCRKK